jgi:hydrogenase maturation protein HypF
VFIEVEGNEAQLHCFLERLESETPAISSIQSLEASFLDPVGYSSFEIRESSGGKKTALILPDIATCPDCLREISDPGNRRYRYPFTNCTNCGPRFTIIESLPYDRPRTAMKQFVMCDECAREYHDPADRRFHAQPNACPACGPHLELWDSDGSVLAMRDNALRVAVEAIRKGKIVAVKGLGGFHLIADARNDEAVRELRRRKRREEKPFAVMYPSLQDILADCECSEIELRMLRSPESPIVLLRRKDPALSLHARERQGWAHREALAQTCLSKGHGFSRGGSATPWKAASAAEGGRPDSRTLAPSTAPRSPYIGAMLPYTPLHHLLMQELGFPVVATSGNLSEETICIDEHEALQRLKNVADLFLVHNRPILRHVDDSILREMAGRELVLRRARGFAPLPVYVQNEIPSVIALGAHQKNAIASSVGAQVFVSQHIGDLETSQSLSAFENVNQTFRELYELNPAAVVCDMHPDYASTRYALRSYERVISVQHHYAHVLSCMAENQLRQPVLGVAWDGSGFGPDNTVWGGEFLQITEHGYERVAHLRTFRLPGGEKAVKEPRRVALAILYELYGEDASGLNSPVVNAFSKAEIRVLCTMLAKHVNSPVTSSAGRLFDAVAALAGIHQTCGYEGQAAMELEFAAGSSQSDSGGPILSEAKGGEVYPFTLHGNATLILDWEPMIRAILDEREDVCTIARRFHHTLAHMIVVVAERVGERNVVLSGGCFQNRLLTEMVIRHLRAAGFQPYWHQRIPPNDGGIALGQVVAAARELEREPS